MRSKEQATSSGAVLTEPEPAALRAAYHRTIGRQLRERLHLTVVTFAVLVGISIVLEGLYHPERAHLAARIYVAELLACSLGLLACRLWAPGTVGAVLAAVLALLMSWYNGQVGGPIRVILPGAAVERQTSAA